VVRFRLQNASFQQRMMESRAWRRCRGCTKAAEHAQFLPRRRSIHAAGLQDHRGYLPEERKKHPHHNRQDAGAINEDGPDTGIQQVEITAQQVNGTQDTYGRKHFSGEHPKQNVPRARRGEEGHACMPQVWPAPGPTRLIPAKPRYCFRRTPHNPPAGGRRRNSRGSAGKECGGCRDRGDLRLKTGQQTPENRKNIPNPRPNRRSSSPIATGEVFLNGNLQVAPHPPA